MSDRKIALRKFLIKLFNWEYWPFGIIQFPVILYYLWLSLRARSFFFFSASNPGIDMGGMFGESKYDILKKIPREYVPRTIHVSVPASVNSVVTGIVDNGIAFPAIFKPDIGERGYRVKKVSTEAEANEYCMSAPFDFLVQELVDLPVELGVFYQRYPDQENGVVTSIVMKELLYVTGDGKSDLRTLILNKDRALLQWEKLKVKFQTQLDSIVPAGERIELVSIGNHVLGTKFLNGNHLINHRLNNIFDSMSKMIDGFYFGRFDLRCASIDELYEGNIKILELNGCGAEPAHIYDPDFPLVKAIAVLLRHWKTIFEIARQNRKKGIQYIRFQDAKVFYRKFKNAIR